MKKTLGFIVGLGALAIAGFLTHDAAAYFYDQILQAGIIQVFSNGILKFNIQTEPGTDDSLVFRNQVNGTKALDITTNTVVEIGSQVEFAPGAFTSAQIAAKTPAKVGTFIYNTTINAVCYSTGVVIMGYAKISSGTVITSPSCQ